ncbi:MAG: EAL domain-containing protein [Peptostreptococcales bacterium]
MAHIPLFFSLLFFAAFIMYLVFGIYTLQINSKAGLNKIFFAICLSLCLWSLGFSVATFAQTWETCYLWRRISAIGWGTIYSLLLHYFLVMTTNRFSRRTWVYCVLLYLPAVISVYAFGVSEAITINQYNFIKTEVGWINVAVQNAWTTFFQIYYVSYMLACFFLILQWKKHHSKDLYIRRQANLFLISLTAAFLLGSLTDVLLPSIAEHPLPQMAPIFTLVPIGAIYYSMKNYKLMAELRQEEDDVLITNETLLKIQSYIGFAYLIGGLASVLSSFFPHLVNSEESMQAMLYGGIIISFIGIVVLLTRLMKSKKIREMVLPIIILCSIPLITMQFVNYASITIWVFPLALMVASLVFNSRKYLVLLTIVSATTQIFVWINAPKGAIYIDEFDYILRISILLITCMLGSFVNKTYTSRLEENIFQINFQRLVSGVSADFITINQMNMNEKLDCLLDKMGHFFLVDRTYIFLINRHHNTMTYAYEWCNQGISPETELIQNVPVDVFPWWMDELSVNKLVYVEDVAALPEAAKAEKETLEEQAVKSVVVIPIEQDGIMLGFIGLDSVTSKKKWALYHIELLRLLSNLIADALIRIESEKTIEYMAYYDHLTGLPNRTLFSDRLSQAIHLAKKNQRFVSVIFLDLDGFKMVNDTMGHSGGDALLKEISHGLVSRLRQTDTVARFGGDEFLILVNDLKDENDTNKVTDTVMELFEHPFYVNEQEFYVTASAGVAIYPFDGDNTETLIKNADIAMYMAKDRGKNQYVMCTTDMKEEVKRNIKLSNQLYRVQEKGELVLHYQPQVKLSTGKIVGLEALLRWKHPEIGMIPPSVFIPLAEMNGTIMSIGKWVLETAIHQNKEWQKKGFPPIRIAVNLSLVQFSNPDFVNQITSILKEAKLEPKYLELEITESIATKESSHITGALNQLKEFGISISIDDFGTEYSSLSRLKALPIDRIKIDMQFIQGIEGCEKDQAITKVIINLAKSLGLEVLAEGVETSPQLDFLNQKMCDEVQGYYCYKPMPAEEIETIFRKQMYG